MAACVELMGTPRQAESCSACSCEGFAFMETDGPGGSVLPGARVVYCFACYHTLLGARGIHNLSMDNGAIADGLIFLINRLCSPSREVPQ